MSTPSRLAGSVASPSARTLNPMMIASEADARLTLVSVMPPTPRSMTRSSTSSSTWIPSSASSSASTVPALSPLRIRFSWLVSFSAESRSSRLIRLRVRATRALRTRKRISLEDLDSALKETSQLNLILKGDNAGTVEALEEALLGIQVDDEVELRVIDRGVGGITETNVNLASASDAIIIGFNVRAEGEATEPANREGVEIRYYSVIYQAIDEIETGLQGRLNTIYEEVELGRAEIRAIFRSSKIGNIAGCMVTSGSVK